MNSPYRYTLQPYSGPASRHTCPQCGKRRVFTRYLDQATGGLLPDHVGKCDRADKCGYHYTPKQHFADGGEAPLAGNWEPKPELVRPRHLHTRDQVQALRTTDAPNTLSQGWEARINAACGAGSWQRVCRDYALGTWTTGTLAGAAVFWQVDVHGNVRAGKVMLYDPATGKRRKDIRSQSWAHFEHTGKGAADLNVEQCLFGEHLIPRRPDAVVAAVESEKTAMIAAACVPSMVWVATGALGEFKLAKLQALTGRHVVAFPDLSIGSKAYEQWCSTAYELRGLFASIHVSDLLEAGATVESTLAGEDIADQLLREAKATTIPALPQHILSEAEKALQSMAQRNPTVNTVVDVLGLDLAAAKITPCPIPN